jgi:hypothetical protein
MPHGIKVRRKTRWRSWAEPVRGDERPLVLRQPEDQKDRRKILGGERAGFFTSVLSTQLLRQPETSCLTW